jgi:hypothetical protein
VAEQKHSREGSHAGPQATPKSARCARGHLRPGVRSPEAVNLLSAAQVGLELGVVEVPGLAAESAFDLMSRLQLAHIVTEDMDARARCLESPEIDQTRARILRDSFAAACVRP